MIDAFGIDREVSKGLKDMFRLGKPMMGMKPAPMGVTHTSSTAPGLSDAMSGIARGQRSSAAAQSAKKGQEAMSGAMGQINRQMAAPAPRVPNQAQALSGTKAYNDEGREAVATARRAVRGRKERNNRLKIAGYTGAAAVGSGGAVLGADAVMDRRSAKAKRAHLAG